MFAQYSTYLDHILNYIHLKESWRIHVGVTRVSPLGGLTLSSDTFSRIEINLALHSFLETPSFNTLLKDFTVASGEVSGR